MFYRKAMVRESVTQKVIKVVLLFIFFFSFFFFLRFTFKSINNKKYVQVEQSGLKKTKKKTLHSQNRAETHLQYIYLFIYFFSNSAF